MNLGLAYLLALLNNINNIYFLSAIRFQRLFAHVTLYLQEIYLSFSNANVSTNLDNSVTGVSKIGTVSKGAQTGNIL